MYNTSARIWTTIWRFIAWSFDKEQIRPQNKPATPVLQFKQSSTVEACFWFKVYCKTSKYILKKCLVIFQLKLQAFKDMFLAITLAGYSEGSKRDRSDHREEVFRVYCVFS